MIKHLRALFRDTNGTYQLIQFVLILPIFVLILYGSFELLKLASIRQSLEAGTYQAARYLSVYHKYYFDTRYNRESADDILRAELMIRESLLASPFISEDLHDVILWVRYYDGAGRPIASPVDFDCVHVEGVLGQDPMASNLVFTVHATLAFPWDATILGQLLPGVELGHVTLSSKHTAFVDCGPWKLPPQPTPTTTPTATPAP